MFGPARSIGGAILAAALGAIAAVPAGAATITMVSSIHVNPGGVVPDFSPFEPGGALEGQSPIGDLAIEFTGLDAGGDRAVQAVLTRASPIDRVSEFARVGVKYSNTANHAFDVFDVFFDFAASGLIEYDDNLEDARLEGTATGDFKRRDLPLSANGALASFVFLEQFPPPRAHPSDFVLDAFTATGTFRLEPGEMAIFVIDLNAVAAEVPLPAGLPLLAGGVGLLGVLARRRRRAKA